MNPELHFERGLAPFPVANGSHTIFLRFRSVGEQVLTRKGEGNSRAHVRARVFSIVEHRRIVFSIYL